MDKKTNPLNEKWQLKKTSKNRLFALYIVLVICILTLSGIYIHDVYNGKRMDRNLSQVIKRFRQQEKKQPYSNDLTNQLQATQTTLNQTPAKEQPEVIKTDGFTVIGIISVPSRGIEYPILKERSDAALKVSVCQIAGGDLNTSGNVCLAGHNMRNGRLFAQIRYLKNGSIIKITDGDGQTLSYKVFKKFNVESDDVGVLEQNTDGRKVITLITCTDDGNKRLIVQAESLK